MLNLDIQNDFVLGDFHIIHSFSEKYYEPIETLNKGLIEQVKRNNGSPPNLRVLFCVKVFWYILNGTLVPSEDVVTQAPAVEIYSFYRNDNREIKII